MNRKKYKIPEIKGKSFNLKHTRIVIRKWYLHSKLIRKTWIVQIYKRTTFLLNHRPTIKINRKKNERSRDHSLKSKFEIYSNIVIQKRYLHSKLIRKIWIIQIYKRTTFLLDHYSMIEINRKKNETKHHSLKNKSEVYSNSYSKAISSKLISKTWIVEIYKKTRLLIDQYPIIEINQKKNETR